MANKILSTDQLNERETEILIRIADGSSDQEIADELYLSLNTVKWYNRKIYEKLGVNSRTQAIARAREQRLFDADTIPKSDTFASVPADKYHLPAEVNPFIGRKTEGGEVELLLQKNRLVTLVGPPGSGKTRLSLYVAQRVADQFNDGIYFIPLGPVVSTGDILWAIGERLDFQFESKREPLEQLLKFLGEKKLLLVMDNFEHLIAGAALLVEILQAASKVKILVTSRERLGLYGEATYPLSGMALPHENQPDQIARSEAVELFIDRAQSAGPHLVWNPRDLSQVARICHMVDGMPLGIELAASWMDVLLPGEIADEIEHNLDILEIERPSVPHTQRSIRAAFDRSWKLLDNIHRAAFRRLSVFRGGFTREAAGAVAEIELRDLRVLVNKSLLRHNPQTGRYDIHELLRHYAGEKLKHSGEAEKAYRSHAVYFANFMEERWAGMKDHRQKTALSEMEADIENIRSAWHFWIKAGNVGQIKKFLHSFWAIYDVRGWYPAGIDLFEQAVKVMQSNGTQEAEVCLGWLLAAQGIFSIPVADYDNSFTPNGSLLALVEHGLYAELEVGARRGLSLAEKGVQILKRTGQYDEMILIPLISMFITAIQLRGEKSLAVQAASECLEAATRLDDQWAIAKARQFLAVRAIEDGDYPKAERLALEAYHAFERSGNYWSASVVCIEALGLLAIAQQQYAAAQEWIKKGLKAAEEIDFKYSMQTAYFQLGYVSALEGNYTEAGRFWQKALRVDERMLGGRTFIGLGSAPGNRIL